MMISLLTREAVWSPPVGTCRRSFVRRTCVWHVGKRRRVAVANPLQSCDRSLCARLLTCGIWCRLVRRCHGPAPRRH